MSHIDLSTHGAMPMNIINNLSWSEVRPSQIHGNGVFATEEIRRGWIIGRLDGQVMLWRDYIALFDGDQERQADRTVLSTQHVQVRGLKTQFAFINHSADPNCAISIHGQHVYFHSIRDIKAGEELTRDYRAEPTPASYQEAQGDWMNVEAVSR
ncbi:SET domain-containing protein [Azonexus hydrophilus]|uniref:SET domain-containing protein n=1 Tax=Azonexus hydrophilus TaxID=418702 RepID=A0ABZ2XPP8_9RHOO